MDFNIESRIDSLCSVAEVKHGSPPMVAQAIISVDSCLAKRRPFCGFEKLKPVGFCGLCILWELHTKELQVKLYEHQDANLHDKLQLVSLQISNEPNILLGA